jgi:hypothetical protein
MNNPETDGSSFRAPSPSDVAATSKQWHHTGHTPDTIRTRKRKRTRTSDTQSGGEHSEQAAHGRAPSGPRHRLSEQLARLAVADPGLSESLGAYVRALRVEAARNRIELRRLRARVAELEGRQA